MMRFLLSYRAVEEMRRGASPTEAAEISLRTIRNVCAYTLHRESFNFTFFNFFRTRTSLQPCCVWHQRENSVEQASELTTLPSRYGLWIRLTRSLFPSNLLPSNNYKLCYYAPSKSGKPNLHWQNPLWKNVEISTGWQVPTLLSPSVKKSNHQI